jgi:hypothetical protein
MAITNGYCTLSELKAVLRITDSVDDTLLELRIEEASRVIDNHCGRRFYADANATARLYAAINDSVLMVDDISSLTGLVVKTDVNGDGTYSSTLTSTDFQTEPLNALAQGLPISILRASVPGKFPLTQAPAGVQVTAKWGWPSVPNPIRSACILLAGRLVKRGDSLLGVAGFGDLGAITVRAIDPDVERMLRPFKIMTVA